MKVKNNILLIGIVVSLMIQALWLLKEEDPPIGDPTIEIKKDSAIAVSEKFKAQSDSLKKVYEKLNEDHEKLLLKNLNNQIIHENHIVNNIINASDDELILEAFEMADSIIQSGYGKSSDLY